MTRRTFTAAALTGIAAGVSTPFASNASGSLTLLSATLFVLGVVAWRAEGVR